MSVLQLMLKTSYTYTEINSTYSLVTSVLTHTAPVPECPAHY